jgi:hypothetical protein
VKDLQTETPRLVGWGASFLKKAKAFSSEVDTGSREENASKQKDRAFVPILSERKRL